MSVLLIITGGGYELSGRPEMSSFVFFALIISEFFSHHSLVPGKDSSTVSSENFKIKVSGPSVQQFICIKCENKWRASAALRRSNVGNCRSCLINFDSLYSTSEGCMVPVNQIGI